MKRIWLLLVIWAISIQFIMSLPVSNAEEISNTFIPDREDIYIGDIHLVVIAPPNGTAVMPSQDIQMDVALFFENGTPPEGISIFANDELILELTQENMYRVRITMDAQYTFQNLITFQFGRTVVYDLLYPSTAKEEAKQQDPNYEEWWKRKEEERREQEQEESKIEIDRYYTPMFGLQIIGATTIVALCGVQFASVWKKLTLEENVGDTYNTRFMAMLIASVIIIILFTFVASAMEDMTVNMFIERILWVMVAIGLLMAFLMVYMLTYKKIPIVQGRFLAMYKVKEMAINIKNAIKYKNKDGEICIAEKENGLFNRIFGRHMLFQYYGEDNGVNEKVTINDKKTIFIDDYRIREENIGDVLRKFGVSEAELKMATPEDIKNAPKEMRISMAKAIEKYKERKAKGKLRKVFEVKPSVAMSPKIPFIVALFNYISPDAHRQWDNARDKMIDNQAFAMRMLNKQANAEKLYDLFGQEPTDIVSKNWDKLEEIIKTHGNETTGILNDMEALPDNLDIGSDI